jgi:hypothetical protein
MSVKHMNSPVPVDWYLHFQFHWKFKTCHIISSLFLSKDLYYFLILLHDFSIQYIKLAKSSDVLPMAFTNEEHREKYAKLCHVFRCVSGLVLLLKPC